MKSRFMWLTYSSFILGWLCHNENWWAWLVFGTAWIASTIILIPSGPVETAKVALLGLAETGVMTATQQVDDEGNAIGEPNKIRTSRDIGEMFKDSRNGGPL